MDGATGNNIPLQAYYEKKKKHGLTLVVDEASAKLDLPIAKDIPLFATDAFAFNNNTPIKAIGKNHYIKENNAIIMKMIGDSVKSEAFALPQKLESGAFNMNHQPLYIAPAV